jgi:ribosomal-protein-alanine N-acetyltransferase
MRTFEFDAIKHQINHEKHRISFIDAQVLCSDPNDLEIQANVDSEQRFLVMGLIKNKQWSNVTRYLSSRMPYPYTREHAQWWVETGSKNSSTTFAIDLKSECIGIVGVRFGEHETQYSCEIGNWIAEPHWGKGIASEATSRMTDYVFTETAIVRISALGYSPNKASIKVLEIWVHVRSSTSQSGIQTEHFFG